MHNVLALVTLRQIDMVLKTIIEYIDILGCAVV